MDSPIASSTSQDTLRHSANTLRLFVDTEFTDFANCDLISIGLVSSQGHAFYGENLDFDRSKSSQFVKDNIYPYLNPNQFGAMRHVLSDSVYHFINTLPSYDVIIAVDYPADWWLLNDLLGKRHPKIVGVENIFVKMSQWVLSTSGVNEQDRIKLYNSVKAVFFEGFTEYFNSNPSAIRHHARDDAAANAHGYNRIVREFGFPL